LIEQYASGAFWDIVATGGVSLMGYIAWLLRKSVQRMEVYDLALFGNLETKTPGILDKLCDHEKRLNHNRAALISTISELTKKGVINCDGDVRDAVVDLKKD